MWFTMPMEWPLLASLTTADRSKLLESARRRHFARGEVVFHEGDPGDSLHLIEAGRFAVQVFTPGGEAATLNVLSPGGFFGELALLRSESARRRTATIVALEPSRTLSLSGATFHAICDQHPQVEQLMSALLAQRVEDLSQRLLEALYVGVDRRVCRRLLELADVYGEGTRWVIPLTQEHLADLAGASRPTVNQVLQKLSSKGVVALHRGRMEVLDYEALYKRTGKARTDTMR
jgi:CRP/FNR family cyclic AMP-dependent transcriptional regulator